MYFFQRVGRIRFRHFFLFCFSLFFVLTGETPFFFIFLVVDRFYLGKAAPLYYVGISAHTATNTHIYISFQDKNLFKFILNFVSFFFSVSPMSRATFQCRVCDRIFSRQARLRCHKRSFQHYLIDDIILPRSLAFECLWCDFQSDSSSILATHTARNHSFKKSLSIFKSLPRFQCPFEKCKTIANSKDTMRSHFYQVHRSQEAFKTFLDKFYTKCIHCKTEIRNSNYKSHFHWCKSIERN